MERLREEEVHRSTALQRMKEAEGQLRLGTQCVAQLAYHARGVERIEESIETSRRTSREDEK